MSEINYDEVTKQIIEGISDTNAGNSIGKNIIKTEIGSIINGRFVLYRPNPKASIYHYFHHGWKTNGGNYVSYLCPQTKNEKCPICSKSIQLWKSNDAFLKESSKKIRRKENWLVNFYVIDDNKDENNNGKVKIFRYGQQVKDIVDEALTGADKTIYGTNIWRLDKGCSFRISVKPNSDKKDAWPSYTSSKFLPASDLNLTPEKVMSILDSTHDLTTLYTLLSYEELVAELQKNFIDDLNSEKSLIDSSTNNTTKPQLNNSSVATPAQSVKTQEPTTNNSNQQSTENSADAEIDDLLNQLN